MTEMLVEILDWAKQQTDAKSVQASTEKTNNASCKVLEKIISLR